MASRMHADGGAFAPRATCEGVGRRWQAAHHQLVHICLELELLARGLVILAGDRRGEECHEGEESGKKAHALGTAHTQQARSSVSAETAVMRAGGMAWPRDTQAGSGRWMVARRAWECWACLWNATTLAIPRLGQGSE